MSDRGKASPHAFRKTILQLAREGQDLNHQVAKDAAVNESVMLTHYIEEHAEQYWHASNRTFQRILAAADPEVLLRYGYESSALERLKSQVAKGIDRGDWKAVESAAKKLRRLDQQKKA
jgi:predicted component of type VI protein secretion system